MKIDKSQKFSDFFTKNDKKCRKIDFLLLHHIEADSAQEAISMLRKHEVSSHYLIDEWGKIFELVSENDIAYHAGVSYWRGVDGLNATSIGVEFVNHDVLGSDFTKGQLESGLKLCQDLQKRYQIEAQNVVGHSDVGYFAAGYRDSDGLRVEGYLDRKDDPSYRFDWKFLAENGVGVFPEGDFGKNDDILFKFGEKNDEIAEIKQKMADFGYKVTNFEGDFDIEMQLLTRVFNRRFYRRGYELNPDIWWAGSSFALDGLLDR